MPVVTASLIAVNVFVFLLELTGGDAFVTKWALIPADIVAGRHLVTILTSMFMHASWSHIIGNMVFLWAFGPEIETWCSIWSGAWLPCWPKWRSALVPRFLTWARAARSPL